MNQYEEHMNIAFEQALKSYSEGGCPIGAVLVDNQSGKILGLGHNCLVQEGNPIIHGEMSALRNAGRLKNRHHTTIYTSLVPCFMCAGTIYQFGISRVVIADSVNSTSRETIDFLVSKGIELVLLNPETSQASKKCVELVARFKQEKPDLWLEDWGGGVNPVIESNRQFENS